MDNAARTHLGLSNRRKSVRLVGMTLYVIVNRVPEDYRGAPESTAAWNAWFDELGESLVDRGNPVFTRESLGGCGAGSVLGGYTVVSAPDLEAAVALARDCPALKIGGGVEVGELLRLNEGRHHLAPPFSVEVSVHLVVPPGQVFPYLTDPARYVRWMGVEATLEPVPGGNYRVRMPDGFEAAGAFLGVEPPDRVVFTWGFASQEASELVKHEAARTNPMPAGSTRVTVRLVPEDGGTRLTLRHDDLPTVELRDGHRVAWETYLQRLVIRTAGGDPGPDPHS